MIVDFEATCVRLLLYLFIGGTLLYGCDSSDPMDEPDPEPVDNTVTSIVITADQQRVIGIDASIQLTAEARNAQGGAVPNQEFVWTSANQAIATVNATGQVVTTGIGKVRIEAETAGITGAIEIDALPDGAQQLMVTTPYPVLPHGGFTLQLELTALDALGEPILNPAVSWSSSNSQSVSVNESGQVSTGDPGGAFVFVESDNAEAQLRLDVIHATGDGISDIDLPYLTTFLGIDSTEDNAGPMGMSVALIAEGRLVMARGYGTARGQNPMDGPSFERVQPNSIFRIADVSKPITAVSVLNLVGQGELSLEDSLLSVVPSLLPSAGLGDERARGIRMWNLLEHKGGWDRNVSINPLYNLQTVVEDVGGALPPSHETVGQWLLTQPLDFEPGTEFAFNDMNYFLLGQVIEEVSGLPYESFVQQEILEPIGITSMQIGKTLEVDRLEGEVEYYHGGLGPSVFNDLPGDLPVQYGGSFHVPLLGSTSGWVGSAIDLARFGLSVHRRLVVSDDVLFDYMVSDNSGNGVYGAGWILDGRNYLHTGLIDGSSSILYVFEDGTVLAILLNGNSDANFRRWLDPIIPIEEWPAVDLFGQY